jgi:glyoxylase-like metal-dependent hydrolase (beta-lactamase superfamily II)
MMVPVGDIRVDPLIDGHAWMPAQDAYPQARPGSVDTHFGSDGLVRMPIGAFLIRGGDHVVLVDAGAGPLQRAGFSAGALVDELARLGVTTGDVTDVVLTHLHWDHVGWTTQKGTIVFERALYRCHEADWEHFLCDDGAARKLSPLRDRMERWDTAGPILPGIDALPAPGHTPGHTMIVVSSGRERAVILGDAAHCPIEIEDLEMGGIADVDPSLPRSSARARSSARPTSPSWRSAGSCDPATRGDGSCEESIARACSHHV